MTLFRTSFAVLALGATAAAVPAEAKSRDGKAAAERAQVRTQAVGTPQRDSSRTPPGLAALLASPNRGVLRALIATEGSNSRLQDQPASP